MQKESMLAIVGLLVVSVVLLFAVDYFGVPTGKATEFQGPGPAASPSPPPAYSYQPGSSCDQKGNELGPVPVLCDPNRNTAVFCLNRQHITQQCPNGCAGNTCAGCKQGEKRCGDTAEGLIFVEYKTNGGIQECERDENGFMVWGEVKECPNSGMCSSKPLFGQTVSNAYCTKCDRDHNSMCAGNMVVTCSEDESWETGERCVGAQNPLNSNMPATKTARSCKETTVITGTWPFQRTVISATCKCDGITRYVYDDKGHVKEIHNDACPTP